MDDVNHRDRVRRHAESRLAAFRRNPRGWAATRDSFLAQVEQTYELLYMTKHERAGETDIADFVRDVRKAMIGAVVSVPAGAFDDEWARDKLDKAREFAATRLVP